MCSGLQVVRLIDAVNRAFTTHGLPTFYEVREGACDGIHSHAIHVRWGRPCTEQYDTEAAERFTPQRGGGHGSSTHTTHRGHVATITTEKATACAGLALTPYSLHVDPCMWCVLQEPLPHVSLAWSPGDEAGRLQPWLDALSHDPIQLKVRLDTVGLFFLMLSCILEPVAQVDKWRGCQLHS